MLKTILNNLFPQPAPQVARNVDSVLSAFNQTIADLEELSREGRASAEQAERDRTAAEIRRDACETEAARASTVASKLRNLIQAA